MSLPWSNSSWRQTLAGRARNNRNSNRQPDLSQDRETSLLATAANRTVSNEQNTNAPHNRYPLSSLLASGTRTHLSRPGRGDAGATRGGGTSETAAAASLRRNTAAGNRPVDSASSLAVAPTASVREETPSTAEAASSDVGSDLLEFGASVEFHEDHRRHIHDETQQIEASNVATRDAVSKESRAEVQLQKDLGRSRAELLSLGQGADDQFESAKMFLTLTRNLNGELRSGIIEPTKPTATAMTSTTPTTPANPKKSPSVSHTVTPDGRNQETSNRENDSSLSNGEELAHPSSNKEILAEKQSRANKLLQILKNEAKSFEFILAESSSLKEKQVQLEESMEFQGLENSLERAREDERRLQSELKQERDTKATRIVEIQQIRESCGAKAQKCTDLTKALTEAKKNNAIKESTVRKQLQTNKAEVDRLVKKKEEMMVQIELEKRNLEKASKEMDDYNYYCKAREDYKKETALRSEKKKELLARQAEANRGLEQAQEAEKASLLRVSQAKEAMRLAEAQKKANDEMEANVIVPGKAELANLTERKMELAKQIAEASKTADQEQAKEREALAAKTRATKDAIEEAEMLQTEYKAKQEETEATSKMHQEFIESHNEQIAFYESEANKFEEMYEAESKVYEMKLQEGRERWSEKVLHHAQEQEGIGKAHAFKVDVLERAIRLLKEAQKAERKAQAG